MTRRLSEIDALREAAEALLAGTRAPEPSTLEGPPRLVHELRVHQVALELQREELRRTQLELDVARSRASEPSDALLERFSLVIEATKHGWYDVDVTQGTVAVGPEYARMLGYDPSTFVETVDDWVNRLHPEDREPSKARYLRYLAGELPTYRAEFRQRTAQGHWKWLLSVGAVVRRDAHGKPQRMVGTHTEIDHLKALEESLRGTSQSLTIALSAAQRSEASLRLFESAIAQAPSAVVITDADGRIEFVNRAFAKVTGWSAAEAHGQTMRLVRSELTPQATYADLWATIKAGKEWRGELQNRRRDGQLFWAQTSIAPVRDEAGVITHFVGVQADTTEKKQLEVRLLRTQRLETTGALASGVAHDLNNMLAPILLFTSMLRDPAHASSAQLIADIEASTRDCIAVVQRLLSFSRGGDEALVALSPGEVLRDFIGVFRRSLPAGVTLEADVPAEGWPVHGDATQLRQLLVNLCVNARDAMPRGGTLSVSLRDVTLDHDTIRPEFTEFWEGARPGRWVCITVADTGVGIPHEVHERLFEPFFTTKDKGTGTGLGLATVAQICRRHGGFIWPSSPPGQGARFEVYLPAATGAPPAPADANTAREGPGGGRLVLVADDDAAVLRSVRLTLEAAGYRVVTARDGRELLELAQAGEEPRLVLSDVSMPRLGGVAATATLKARAPTLPVLLMTGDPSARLPVGTRALAKPFSARELLDRVAQALVGRE
ncbi:MAG: PAS domain S-box protein [Myxococcus sp.]|nr:PAS domain S-box protein [Myxococcus sp.]